MPSKTRRNNKKGQKAGSSPMAGMMDTTPSMSYVPPPPPMVSSPKPRRAWKAPARGIRRPSLSRKAKRQKKDIICKVIPRNEDSLEAMFSKLCGTRKQCPVCENFVSTKAIDSNKGGDGKGMCYPCFIQKQREDTSIKTSPSKTPSGQKALEKLANALRRSPDMVTTNDIYKYAGGILTPQEIKAALKARQQFKKTQVKSWGPSPRQFVANDRDMRKLEKAMSRMPRLGGKRTRHNNKRKSNKNNRNNNKRKNNKTRRQRHPSRR